MNVITSLPVFVAVVECGSFSLAAKQLGLTKSAVSKRITLLEESLGIRLLNRTTRKLSLTEAGARYFEYASQAVELAQKGVDAVTELQGTPQGRLKITLPMSFGILHISPLIKEFLELYPKIEIDLQLEDAMVDLVEQGFDLGIRIGDLPVSNLVARRLAPCKSVLCAAPQYLDMRGSPKTPGDLVRYNCLRYSYFRGGSDWRFSHGGEVFKVVPKGNFEVNNSEAIRQVVLRGLGIAQLPTFIAGKDLASGNLVHLLEEYALPEHSIYAVFPERKHMPLKVRVFIDFICEKLGTETPYWDRY
ncbi:transcriptional regulator [Vibrio sp. JCM 19236]|nr:transcriptional regulator [Vibrio sp. JCM 19236]